MESRWVDPAGIALERGTVRRAPGSVRGQRNHAGRPRSSQRAQPKVHSVVTDSTATMAIRKGISLVMRQKRAERTEVPA